MDLFRVLLLARTASWITRSQSHTGILRESSMLRTKVFIAPIVLSEVPFPAG